MSKLEVEASDKKLGMTLEELKKAVERFIAIAKINETDTSTSKIGVMINFGGGIKSITAEV
jgi:hypothetical protein